MNQTELADRRILVVDDDPEAANLTARSLELFGVADHVATAASAGNAHQKMLAEPFDLVITDLHMPGVDGLTLLGQIRAHYPNIRLVLLTGDISPEIESRAHQAGVHCCISKPFPAERLAATILALLDMPGDAGASVSQQETVAGSPVVTSDPCE